MVSLKYKNRKGWFKRQERNAKLNPQRSAWKISLLYATLGLIWIFSSDWIVSFLWAGSDFYTLVNMTKGWVYVIATSFILFALIASALGEAQRHERDLHRSYEELKELHNQLSESEQLTRNQLRENQANQVRLNHLAYFDSLTDLPNRLSLQRDIQKAIDAKMPLAVIFVDLDNFKDINDFRSHEIGDRLLQKVTQRLKTSLKQAKEIYRSGGDEFVILSPGKSQQAAIEIAQDILDCFREPFALNDSPVYLTASIGLTYSTSEPCTISDLLKHVDLAMYQSKKRGGNCYTVFSQELAEDSVNRILLEQKLRSMWQNNQFTVFYQPVVSVADQSIIGFEALLRWEPKGFIKAPVDQVIKVAEANGLIIPIGEWILREACIFTKKAHSLGFSNALIAVNISMVQFSHSDFVQTVQAVLKETDLNPEFLRLEITESVLMESYDLIKPHLEPLRKLGIKMALDDFGKGYSSLSYLKDLPLDTLKIDKSFIDHIATNTKDALLASHIISIGTALNLHVVAEGVESPEQLQYLQKHNCESFQGYLYSPPLSEANAFELLKEKKNKVSIV